MSRTKFDQINPLKILEDIKDLDEQLSELRKKQNPNIELQFDKTEKWHDELLRKRETLKENKMHIE